MPPKSAVTNEQQHSVAVTFAALVDMFGSDDARGRAQQLASVTLPDQTVLYILPPAEPQIKIQTRTFAP